MTALLAAWAALIAFAVIEGTIWHDTRTPIARAGRVGISPSPSPSAGGSSTLPGGTILRQSENG